MIQLGALSSLSTLLLICMTRLAVISTSRSPGLPKSRVIAVNEDASVGHVLLSNIRHQLDLSPGSKVKLGPGSLNHFAELDEDSGSLIVKVSLDLEGDELCRQESSCCRQHGQKDVLSPGSDPECRLMAFVLASSSREQGQLTPVSRLYLRVNDLNDNRPIFLATNQTKSDGATGQLKQLTRQFTEGSEGLQAKQDLPLAFDADFSSSNQVVAYWIEWAADGSAGSSLPVSQKLYFHDSIELQRRSIDDQFVSLGPFRLYYSKTGHNLALQLESELDHETRNKYKMQLVAEDGGGLKGRIDLVVNVIDVNEHAPVFVDDLNRAVSTKNGEFWRQISVEETMTIGSELCQLKATDPDNTPELSEQPLIEYRLIAGVPSSEVPTIFNIDSFSGKLSLIGQLDYERTKSYRLTVIAEDNVNQGKSKDPVRRSATAIVEIDVTDVNDNAPVIKFENEHEATPTDTASLITPSHPSPSEVKRVSVKEDASMGSSIAFFSCTDRDTGPNGQITCELVNWTDMFKLRDFHGLFAVELVSKLDRELRDNYQIVIRCRDFGSPMLQIEQKMLIDVEDVNDLPPVFQSSSYQFRITENSPAGTPLQSMNPSVPSIIKATDPDLNSTLTYRLEPQMNIVNNTGHQHSGLDYRLFTVDESSGLITSQGELDREASTQLVFRLCADDGLHSACTSVTVHLDDVNDNHPRFDRDTYVIRVEEESVELNRPLITFDVTDADSGNQGFHFELVDNEHVIESLGNNTNLQHPQPPSPGSVKYHFVLRNNQLYLRRPLDREIRSNYHFNVKVSDSHRPDLFKSQLNTVSILTGEVEVFVDVTDINDNSPKFVFPRSTGEMGNRLSVSCHEPMGSSVGRLKAHDPDIGENGTVVFKIVRGPESSKSSDSLFFLDTQSGELFVNNGQLEQHCGSTSMMVVSVNDQGPSESRSTRINPVERLIVHMEDKPTIAEQMASQISQQSINRRQAAIDDVNSQNFDETGFYGSLSTRTILSVVLGGSTIFLIGLLVVWLLMLLCSRARQRQKLGRRRLSPPTMSVHGQTMPSPSHYAGSVRDGEHQMILSKPGEMGSSADVNASTGTIPCYHHGSNTGQHNYLHCSPGISLDLLYHHRTLQSTGHQQDIEQLQPSSSAAMLVDDRFVDLTNGYSTGTAGQNWTSSVRMARRQFEADADRGVSHHQVHQLATETNDSDSSRRLATANRDTDSPVNPSPIYGVGQYAVMGNKIKDRSRAVTKLLPKWLVNNLTLNNKPTTKDQRENTFNSSNSKSYTLPHQSQWPVDSNQPSDQNQINYSNNQQRYTTCVPSCSTPVDFAYPVGSSSTYETATNESDQRRFYTPPTKRRSIVDPSTSNQQYQHNRNSVRKPNNDAYTSLLPTTLLHVPQTDCLQLHQLSTLTDPSQLVLGKSPCPTDNDGSAGANQLQSCPSCRTSPNQGTSWLIADLFDERASPPCSQCHALDHSIRPSTSETRSSWLMAPITPTNDAPYVVNQDQLIPQTDNSNNTSLNQPSPNRQSSEQGNNTGGSETPLPPMDYLSVQDMLNSCV